MLMFRVLLSSSRLSEPRGGDGGRCVTSGPEGRPDPQRPAPPAVRHALRPGGGRWRERPPQGGQ